MNKVKEAISLKQWDKLKVKSEFKNGTICVSTSLIGTGSMIEMHVTPEAFYNTFKKGF